MAKSRRLNKATLQEDIDAYAALQAIGDYAPSNPDYALANVTTSQQSMATEQTTEVQKQAAADAARDDAVDAEWTFHNNILGVKAQVRAQYGEDSNEYQSLGMKKKSEYRRGGRRPSSGGDTPA